MFPGKCSTQHKPAPGLRGIQSAPVVRANHNVQPDIWDKVGGQHWTGNSLDLWKSA